MELKTGDVLEVSRKDRRGRHKEAICRILFSHEHILSVMWEESDKSVSFKAVPKELWKRLMNRRWTTIKLNGREIRL